MLYAVVHRSAICYEIVGRHKDSVANPKQPTPGRSRQILVDLSPELSLNLWALGEALSGAAHRRLMCEALAEYIERRLDSEPLVRDRFNDAKGRVLRPPTVIRRLSVAAPRRAKNGRRK